MAACEVQAVRLTGAGQFTAMAAGCATLKVELHEAVPQSPVAMKLNVSAAPVQCALAGKAGMLAMLLDALQSPEKVNPAFHAL